MRGSSGRLILIDDSEIDLGIYRRIIARVDQSVEVICFTTAEEALAHIATSPAPVADVILLDISMPRMDGFAFLEILMSRYAAKVAATSVVMLTASDDRMDQARAAEFDIVKDYAVKPLTPADIGMLLALMVPSGTHDCGMVRVGG